MSQPPHPLAWDLPRPSIRNTVPSESCVDLAWTLNCLTSNLRNALLEEADVTIDLLLGCAAAGGTDDAAPGFLQTQCAKRKFFTWNNRNVDLLAKDNQKHAEFYKEFIEAVQPKVVSPRALDRAFGCAAGAAGVEATRQETRDSADPANDREKQFEAFVEGLTQKPSKALAWLHFEALSGVFDEDFETLAKTKNLSLAKYFGQAMAQEQKKSAQEEESPLQKAVRDVHEAFQDIDEAAMASVDSADGEPIENSAPKQFALVGESGAETEARETLWKQHCERRRKVVQFLGMPCGNAVGFSKDPTTAHKQKLVKLWQASKAAKIIDTDPENEKPVGLIFDGGVHLPCLAEGTANAARLPQPLDESGQWSLAWLGGLKGRNMLVLLFDGRVRQTRRLLEDFMETHFPDRAKQVCGGSLGGGGGGLQTGFFFAFAAVAPAAGFGRIPATPINGFRRWRGRSATSSPRR